MKYLNASLQYIFQNIHKQTWRLNHLEISYYWEQYRTRTVGSSGFYQQLGLVDLTIEGQKRNRRCSKVDPFADAEEFHSARWHKLPVHLGTNLPGYLVGWTRSTVKCKREQKRDAGTVLRNVAEYWQIVLLEILLADLIHSLLIRDCGTTFF